MFRPIHILSATVVATLTLTGCGGFDSLGSSGSRQTSGSGQAVELPNGETIVIEEANRRTIFGGGRGSVEDKVQVNKYIWNAALDVLSFLPIQEADPFTGVIITGYGTPPGGNRAYRAVIHVTDPALDARTLNLSLYTRGGAANAATVRSVEDAILTRARQLRTGK